MLFYDEALFLYTFWYFASFYIRLHPFRSYLNTLT